MPRKNRCTALVLVIALLACLAGQAAAAMPATGNRPAASDSIGGDLLGSIWAWVANKWASLGHLTVTPARQAPWASEKQGGSTDPNSGACSHMGSQGSQQP